MYLLTVILQ